MYKYKISVIMPVYNSALYIGEAIESIINQTLGTDSIQLIIVNDGSTDNSAEIIRAYKDKLPCITYIEKENGGVASARNEALKHIEGKYTAFLDPDDTVSTDTYERVISFFEENYDKTDVVSYPIYFFGTREGAHPLNDKFNGEDRVLDLMEAGEFQLHITSSVIKSEIARKITFKPLVTSEDAEALLRLLIDTPRLGIVSGARYNYRKHEVSLINTAQDKREWYLAHLDGYFKSVIDYAREKYSKIPRFVQNAIMYDLSWKINHQKRPSFLTDDEVRDIACTIYGITSSLDDDTILNTPNLSEIVKYHLLCKKHGDTFDFKEDDIALAGTGVAMSGYPYVLEFVEDCVDKIKLSARIFTTVNSPKITQGALYVGGARIVASSACIESRTTLLGDQIVSSVCVEYEIPRAGLDASTTVYFALCVGDTEIITDNLTFGKHFPLEARYSSSFFALSSLIFTHDENTLVIIPKTKKALKKHRRAFERELWKSNGFAERKAVIARLLARAYKAFHKKPIWIINDRLSEAGDNAEALFEYLNRVKFKGARYFFAIRRTEDYSRLKGQGRVLDRASLKYKVIHLASSVIISSQAEDFVTNPFDYYGAPYKDILALKPFVFLQHGVIKDDLSEWLNKYNKNIKGFVTSSRAEYDSILNTPAYHYSENELWLTGLARFDKLENKKEKIITILPTWRRYLAGSIDIATGKWKNSEELKDSELVSFYSSLLSDPRLIDAVTKNGYKILFAPHPNMKGMCDFIDTPPCASVSKHTYAQLYKMSALMVTDYSSAVFDCAYLKKPIIYAQFDKDKFFSGAHTYKRGYFDYEKNGFGPVTYTVEDTVDSIIKCIERDCTIEPLYLERVRSFFAYDDKNSCSRIVEKILSLGEANDNSK